MTDFFRKLFDTSDFPARWNCGNWDLFHGRLHIFSDLAIWGAYSAIPLALMYFWANKRHELAFPRLFWLFGAFIFSCGMTHLIDATIFYTPVYRLSAVAKLMTAVVSWAAVVAVFRIAPKAIELPGVIRMNTALQAQLARTRKAETALARSNRDLEEFASAITHDLRNPMGSALIMAELARESVDAGKIAEARDQLMMVLDSLRQMESSVKELHAQSLVQPAGESVRPVLLSEVLDSVRATLEPQFHATGARLEVGELPMMHGLRTMLGHLFTNLIENAIKYRSSEPPVIEVRADYAGDELIVTVSDNGRGIPEGEHERIFEPEIRAGNVTDEPGSGLGLAMCRRVMERHHGSIHARPRGDGGTVFELRFPEAGKSPQAATQADQVHATCEDHDVPRSLASD